MDQRKSQPHTSQGNQSKSLRVGAVASGGFRFPHTKMWKNQLSPGRAQPAAYADSHQGEKIFQLIRSVKSRDGLMETHGDSLESA